MFTPTSCWYTWLLSCGAPVSLSTFPRPWRAQPCFHTLQHGGTRDPARSAHAMTRAAVRPLRLLVGAKWAVPPPRIQRRLTREPHVTEVGQCWAESRRVYLTRLSVLPHFPDAPPRGLSSFGGGTTAWRLISADLSTSFTLTKTKKKGEIELNAIFEFFKTHSSALLFLIPLARKYVRTYLWLKALRLCAGGVKRMERIPSAQPPPLSKHQAELSDVQG